MYDCLPTVSVCCCCVRDLKLASVLIAVIGMCQVGHHFVIIKTPEKCPDADTKLDNVVIPAAPGREYSYTVEMISFTTLEGLFTLCSLLFLIGVAIDNTCLKEWYVHSICAYMILKALCLILVIAYTVAVRAHCGPNIAILGLSPFFSIFLWFYFLIVVKSYVDEQGGG